MKKHLTHISAMASIVMLAVITLGSCKKSTTPAAVTPPVTITYSMTCKVDDVLVKFSNQTFVKNDTLNPTELFLVGNTNVNNPNQPPLINFDLKQKGPWVAGLSYKLDDTDQKNFVTYTNEIGEEFKSTATSGQDNGGLTITFTTLDMKKNGIAEGTFAGTLQADASPNSVVITEGKFKIKFLN